jgi:hypothetical protein
MRNLKQGQVNLPAARALIDDVLGFVENANVADERNSFNLGAFEDELTARLNGLKRELLRQKLQEADVAAEAVRIDGKVHRRVLDSETTITTTAGPVVVQHRLYRDRTDPSAKSVSALAKRLGLVEGMTPAAAKLSLFLVTELVPDKAAETFERFGGMAPSKSTLDRLPKALSSRWEGNREEYERLLREAVDVPPATTTIVVSLDGVLARMEGTEAPAKRRETAKQGRLTKGPTGFREVGCGTVSCCDDKGDLLQAVRVARAPEYKKAGLKAMLVDEVGVALTRAPGLQLVKIADGALDNWEFLSSDLPDGVEVLDFWHATEHLSAALGAYYGDGSVDARHRFEKLRDTLRDDENGVNSVIRALDRLARLKPAKKIVDAIAHFKLNTTRMNYASLRARGLPIGSGVVEATCKTLVTQRLKRSGMYWSLDGMQAILTPRGWTQSDRFDHAWALLAAEYEATIEIVSRVDASAAPEPSNVIPFPRRGASG